MTPVSWQRVEDILSRALEVPLDRRREFVLSQSGNDQDLSREVLSLIAAHEQSPAVPTRFSVVREALAALETEYYLGRIMSGYRIEEYIGRGATSTVYRAREISTGRDVAIKILASNSHSPPPESVVDHPNIVRMIECNRDADDCYLVMEYVAGETVAQRLRRAPFSPHELIDVARQIANGLAAAHRQGICHGDLKPANVMIGGGTVKILDFGSPAGTADYLSPERAGGEGPDPRSDVYAFGATLYEMATGKRSFGAGRRTAIYPPLAALIDRCMDKDRERRYPDAEAVAAALDQLRPPSRFDSLRAKVKWKLILAAGAIGFGLAAALAGFYSPHKAPPRFQLVTEDTNLADGATLSPDGKLLAYAANRDGAIGLDIWVQTLPMGTPLRLTTDDADDFTPTFSPDGKWILFGSDREGGGLYRIPAGGGVEERIGPAAKSPRYSPDGKWISFLTGPRGPRNRDSYRAKGIYLLPAKGGGAPQPFHAEFASAHSAVWSPDGKRILFSGHMNPQEQDSLWIGKLDGSPPMPVSAPSPERTGDFVFKQNAILPQCWLPDGRLVFQHHQGSQVALMAVSFSLQRSRFMGNPQTLVPAGSQAVNPMCGLNGEMVYTSHAAYAGLWSVSLDDTHFLRPTTRTHPALAALPSLTADGTKLAYVARSDRKSAARLHDLETGDERVLEESKPRSFWQRQSLDGTRIATLEDAAAGGLLRISDQRNKRVYEFPGVNRPLDFSPDARFVLALNSGRESTIQLHQGGGNGSLTLLRHPSMKLNHARFSPDQRWVAFSAQNGEEPPRTFLARFQGAREIPNSFWVPATAGNAVNAEWSPDGQALYFLSEHDEYLCLSEQRLDKGSKSPVGEARVIRHFHHQAISLWQVAHNHRGLSVSRSKVVLNLVSRTGGIWFMR